MKAQFYRPALEELESRCMLSAGFWVGGGVTAGSDGNLWFTEGDGIGRFNPNTGAFQEFLVPPGNSGPTSILSGPDGNIWFTQFDEIGRINPSTLVIQEFHLPPGMNAGWWQPAAGPDGSFWFEVGNPLTGQDAIGRIDLQTGRVQTFNLSSGWSLGQQGITVDANGIVWFSENPSLYVGGLGRFDPKTNSFQNYVLNQADPSAIVADATGNLWFTEYGARGLGMFNPTTGKVQEYQIPSAVPQIIAGPDGNVWMASGYGKIVEINPSDGSFKQFQPPYEPKWGITAGPGPYFWFTCDVNNTPGNGEIGRFDPATGLFQLFAPPSPTPPPQPSPDQPLTGSGIDVKGTAGVDFKGAVATFADTAPKPASAGSYSAIIYWGDGTYSLGTITANSDGTFQVSGAHTYTQGGEYWVHVAIDDNDTSQDPGGSRLDVWSNAIIDPLPFQPPNWP